MIDIETVKFIEMLNELAQKAKSGVKPFAECTVENKEDCVFYDEDTETVDEISHSCNLYRIVLDKSVDGSIHHDVISYYDDLFDGEYQVNVVIPMEEIDEEPLIEVKGDDGVDIIIEPGNWYTI